MRHVIVGGGGVGSLLLPVLCRYLNHDKSAETQHEVLIVDKDSFEYKNQTRQHFTRNGGKAEVLASMYRTTFPNIVFESHETYINEGNAFVYVAEGDVVFCCVDNHPSRLVLSDHVETLDDAVLISGGNEYHDGNLQVHIRRDGESVLPPLTYLHPEIENPTGKHPDDLSCEELAAESAPQLIFANAMVATLMCNAYWCITGRGEVPYSEQYFDLTTGAVRPILRNQN